MAKKIHFKRSDGAPAEELLSRAMVKRLFPTAPVLHGTITLRRSRILRKLRRIHGGSLWEYVHVASDGYEFRCIQCGKARHPCSGKRCQRCHEDNVLCKKLRPGPLGEVLATLLEGEYLGHFQMVPVGAWILGNNGREN